MTGALLVSVYVFVLAAFLGFELISKVPPTLHTPLMSGANAMSGITIVGALSLVAVGEPGVGTWFGVAAVALATVNVVGGFLVTDRMLGKFGRRSQSPAGADTEPTAGSGA
jgi:H+-translocating NAD(P) transhydrogenase subunit alpha